MIIIATLTGLAGRVSALDNIDTLTLQAINPQPLEPTPAKLKPVVRPQPILLPDITYTVIQGDNLISIAAKQNTTWQRLWQKNLILTNPNVIEIGVVLVVPPTEELLADRPVNTTATATILATGAATAPQGSSAGNLYAAGWCTWGVKNWRPDIPNNWGNASEWLYNAQAQGWPTGSSPAAGAIGWTSGHVVYVLSVNSDGTVTYRDMNGRNILYEINIWTVPAGNFSYIY